MNLLVDRSRCVWTLVILASLEGRHLGGGLQEQCQAADQEKAVFANFGHRELLGLQQDSQGDLISTTASTVAGPYFYTPPMHGGRSLSSFAVQLSGVQGVL